MSQPYRSIPLFSDRNLYELTNATPLKLQFSDCGELVAQRYEDLLINQVVAEPYTQGLFRLYVRELSAHTVVSADPLTGAGIPFAVQEQSICWHMVLRDSLEVFTTVSIHPDAPAWMWDIRVVNRTAEAVMVDTLLAQDLGLGEDASVKNNEAYNSQYLDLNPLMDAQMGWVIVARQNQSTGSGVHPALAVGCLDEACAYATDATQFFGLDHRLTNSVAALKRNSLPSECLQYECAIAGLQSKQREIQPGETVSIRYVSHFTPNHPKRTDLTDSAVLHPYRAWPGCAEIKSNDFSNVGASLFTTADYRSGDVPDTADWDKWFPGDKRHREFDNKGQLLSFFYGKETHVVSLLKEASMWRSHGHILKSGDTVAHDPNHFGITAYAAGIFGIQAYLGNPSLNRFIAAIRNQLGVLRYSGQRIFIKLNDRWAQLGIPSVFSMEPDSIKWIYRLSDTVIEVQCRCSLHRPASFLSINVLQGDSCEFLITHNICVGSSEGSEVAHVAVDEANACFMVTAADGCMYFSISALDKATVYKLGGDELIQPDADCRWSSFAALQTKPVKTFVLSMAAGFDGKQSIEHIREEPYHEYLSGNAERKESAWNTLMVEASANASVGCLNDILPWYHHNAGIHFAAPHGLEQSGGGAWGVRDVCQGSLEWLLSIGRFDVARAVLCEVFRQQYVEDGEWPQWFMLDPYQNIRQRESHGDVLLWPLKALCLYVERSNDTAILDVCLPYTNAQTSRETDFSESLMEHCDRILKRLRERLLPGTALINYGHGDWDDTLQPADPALRESMVSAWTVCLAYQTLHQLTRVYTVYGDTNRVKGVHVLLGNMRADFRRYLIVDGVIAGFLIRKEDRDQVLLHPGDVSTGIQYRLIPMTRAVLAGLLDKAEASAHFDLIAKHMLFSDGVRLMSSPVTYRGGEQLFFRRAETAANVGREIGLMYVHAHLRYAEALAYMGDAAGLWKALLQVNPAGLGSVVSQAETRQSNVFFSSSDAAFINRYEAKERWEDLREGKVPVRGGWRLYSSGPGLFINIVRSCLLGIRESFGSIVFDPVIPLELGTLTVKTQLCGKDLTLVYTPGVSSTDAIQLTVNGSVVEPDGFEENPYRRGGLRISQHTLQALLHNSNNTLNITF
ncbi:MAG: hypothetical protein JW739_00145 [Opitutales bacterium]|nr:hypothetical protein [Opitutales bacterium]